MLVLQKANMTIMRIVNGQMLDEPALDLRDSIHKVRCVCDLAILKIDNGTTYGFLYYYLAEVPDQGGNTKVVNRLVRYDISDGKFSNPKLIFEIPSVLEGPHQGGKVLIGPDKNVYLSVGEINHYQTKAQNVKDGTDPDGSGGILRFTSDGAPVDGGLLGDISPLNAYYAYGIRNSFGLNYDPVTGNIWMTDNGPAYGDELNMLVPGFNGGWNKVMGLSTLANKSAFNIADLESFNGKGKYSDPVFEWVEPVGVTDLAFIPSDSLGQEYRGNLFVGEINSGYLYRFVPNQNRTGLLLNGSISDGVANNNVEKLEAVFGKISGGITDLEVGPDGLLYIVSISGKILRLAPIGANETNALPVQANLTDTNATDTNSTDAQDLGNQTIGGNKTVDLSIAPGSSSLTDDAYRPSPVQVSIGDTVRWINNDSQPHSVTSGEDEQASGLFDSDIMTPKQTFEHAFTSAGEYPYYCTLHPNMVGDVIVK
jgi:glucose/arabinose dehydrogenase/plastocyanin